ncbi:gliding motility lipoprotein GldB [Gramella sp. AN32]|uniref:Gliding motility lipoprotein GldB n=1 Tax=Christiangramia antarctica TaxID=2058158 RepID=A0ABW5XA69_9FLAO|nr:gliding motility lipoprotein GldB [Gramella sp. AN32]
MQRFLIAFLSFLLLSSCDENSTKEAEIEKIPVDFELIRFDQKFAEATPETLPQLKQQYPFLFPEQFPDSLWLNKLTDTLQIELDNAVSKAFPEFSAETDDFENLFQHVKYYFPNFQPPTVITVTSEVDYKNKIIYTGQYLFVSLDTYLGEDHPFYVGVQDYLKKNFSEDQILPDAAEAIAKNYVPQPESREFIEHMLYYGKLLYLKDLFIPFKTDAEKIGYTEAELDWVKANEDQIWRYFIEKELLYDTDTNLYVRFLFPAPFSKFYLALDSESPARTGQYIGWNIVRSYMNKNDVSVEKMLKTSAEEIFDQAKYKPKK